MVNPVSSKESTTATHSAPTNNSISTTSRALLSLSFELQRQTAHFIKSVVRITPHPRLPAPVPPRKEAFITLNTLIWNRPEAATSLLQLLARELAPENYKLAQLQRACETGNPNLLPESTQLANELEHICAADSFPDKEFVLNKLDKLISAFIQPAIAGHRSGTNVPPRQLKQLVNISVVFLKALGRLSDNTVTTIGKLTTSHLEQLIGLYDLALRTEEGIDHHTSIESIRTLLDTKRNALTVIQETPLELQNLDTVSRSDRDVVGAAVRLMGWTLSFASEHLKNDREIVLAAVNQNGWALGFASEEMRNDKAVVMSAVQNNGIALQFASQDLRKDRELIVAAVKQNPLAIIHLGPELQRDPTIRALAFHRPQ